MSRGSNTRSTAKAALYMVGALIAGTGVGCVSASNVTSSANGIYMIQGRAIGPWNADKERKKALKRATAYCMKRSQRVLLHSIDEKGHAALLGERATITFECET